MLVERLLKSIFAVSETGVRVFIEMGNSDRPMSEMARRVGCHRSQVYRLLDDLTDRGLAMRTPSAARTHTVISTEELVLKADQWLIRMGLHTSALASRVLPEQARPRVLIGPESIAQHVDYMMRLANKSIELVVSYTPRADRLIESLVVDGAGRSPPTAQSNRTILGETQWRPEASTEFPDEHLRAALGQIVRTRTRLPMDYIVTDAQQGMLWLDFDGPGQEIALALADRTLVPVLCEDFEHRWRQSRGVSGAARRRDGPRPL